MLTPFLRSDGSGPSGLEELQHGVPTVHALARLAAQALAEGRSARLTVSESPTSRSDGAGAGLATDPRLSQEASAILVAARTRALVEIKASPQQFRSSERVLAVFIERDDDLWVPLRDPRDPRRGLRFLEAFAELCGFGLVVHHVQFEFTLTSAGLMLADRLDETVYRDLLQGVGWPPPGEAVPEAEPGL